MKQCHRICAMYDVGCDDTIRKKFDQLLRYEPGQLDYDLNPHPASDSRARSPVFDTRSGHIISFVLPLIQDRQLTVTCESMCTKYYWLTAQEV